MSDPIDRQAAINTAQVMYERCDGDIEGYRDLMCESILALPSVQPEQEYTMEEFMFGQDMGNPEDGSL